MHTVLLAIIAKNWLLCYDTVTKNHFLLFKFGACFLSFFLWRCLQLNLFTPWRDVLLEIGFIKEIYTKVFLFFFNDCEVALTSHICFPIRLVFHQHLNSHIAYPGIPPEPSNHTRGQFLHLPSYPLLRLLWSKSDNKVTRKSILDLYHTGTSLSSTALR